MQMSSFGIGFFVLMLVVALASIFFYLSSYQETVFMFPQSASNATSTSSVSTTTTVKYNSSDSLSVGIMPASVVDNETLLWLEDRTFTLVNAERERSGLVPLRWNEGVADVARMHSKDMAFNNYFSHTGSDGSNVSARLADGNVTYWNESGENILREGGVDYYIVNLLGTVVQTRYKTYEDLAANATLGWMNSPSHRENILNPDFDESGMGVWAFNGSFYLTQDFITRTSCGFAGGPCCHTTGYFPWCYAPLRCKQDFCG
jgi:uncharacterized protein YkwD